MEERFQHALLLGCEDGLEILFTEVWQVHPDGHDGLGYLDDRVDTHADFLLLAYPFQFLVDFQGHKTHADVCTYALGREVEHGPHLQRAFRDTERPFHS